MLCKIMDCYWANFILKNPVLWNSMPLYSSIYYEIMIHEYCISLFILHILGGIKICQCHSPCHARSEEWLSYQVVVFHQKIQTLDVHVHRQTDQVK